MSLPSMSPPLEGPSSPKRKPTPANILLMVLGLLFALCLLGGGAILIVLRPVFLKARETARDRTCLANLREIGANVALYATNNDEELPDPQQWMDRMESQGVPGRTLHCPEIRARSRTAFGYAYNEELNGKKLSQSPPTTPLVFDSDLLQRNAASPPNTLPAPGRHQQLGHNYDNMVLLNGTAVAQRK